MAKKTRLIPAICTQCGGKLEVPDHLEKAHCIYCGTIVIIDKPKIEVRDVSYDKFKEYEDEQKYRKFLRSELSDLDLKIMSIKKDIKLIEKKKMESIQNWWGLILTVIVFMYMFAFFTFIWLIGINQYNPVTHTPICTFFYFLAFILFWRYYLKIRIIDKYSKKYMRKLNELTNKLESKDRFRAYINNYLSLPVSEVLRGRYLKCPKCKIKYAYGRWANTFTCKKCLKSFSIKRI